MKERLIYIAIAFCVCFTYLLVRLSMICSDETYKEMSDKQNISNYHTSTVFANIYDRHLKRLVNETKTNETEIIDDTEIEVMKIERYSDNQLAAHTIGYLRDGQGVAGIELDCNEYLRSNSVIVGVQKLGNEVMASTSVSLPQGVVTTLDKDIQNICENLADKYIKMGAVVVMDVNSGEILASVSRPNFSPNDLYSAICDTENSPLLNRVNQSYNLGSIFKLVIAATAIDSGISPDTCFDCSGSVNVEGHTIKCHKLSGHGKVNMIDAMNDSCNCYFINLGLTLLPSRLVWNANSLSLGRPIKYANNLVCQSGYVPTVSELENQVEKANFSFGQGKLSVTPLQVCEMTCAFANGGKLPNATIIKGFSEDGISIEDENEYVYTQALDESVANEVKKLMVSVVEYEGNSLAKPKTVTAGGKTATAQTGQYNEDGTEKLNCWFTGFCPAANPKYAITILSENGESALKECGACFAEICDSIYTNT